MYISPPRTLGHTYQEVFTGEDFVAWLINVGLAGDRQEGVHYGERLIEGRVMEHIVRKRTFYDKNYYYRFIKVNTTWSIIEHLVEN